MNASSPSMHIGNGRESSAISIAFACALLVHVLVAVGLSGHRALPAEATRVTEIEMIKAPPSEDEPAPDTKPATSVTKDTAPQADRTIHQARAPAHAGALLTRSNDAPSNASNAEPVDFVTDPNGVSYGSGVVARGGTADMGRVGAAPTGAGSVVQSSPAPRVTTEAITKAGDLSRAPRLTMRDPCRGQYPSRATDDAADVSLRVLVRSTGEITSATVLSETPGGQGFGEAARACLLALRMDPGQDKSGGLVTSVAVLVVHFSR